MEQYFKKQKEAITQYLLKYLRDQEKSLSHINMFGPDVLSRLQDFAHEGKMVRGGLILLSEEMFKGEFSEDGLKAACAMELMHTSLLIHDDIMDNDFTRRGKRTIFAQYTDLGEKHNVKNSLAFGQSMGICVGDIGFFLGFSLLSQLGCDPNKKTNIISLFSNEMTAVGLMQMQDVYYGSTDKTVKEEEVLAMYTYKTARYTFTLPLQTGAHLAGQSQQVMHSLDTLGEALGIIFQIKDDELGIYGHEETLGKPIGSDIREEKKTLFYTTLFSKATDEQQLKLRDIFGNPKLTPEMIEYVRLIIETSGTRTVIDHRVSQLSTVAKQLISDLSTTAEYKTILQGLLNYNLSRTK